MTADRDRPPAEGRNRPPRVCPICGKPAAVDAYPFCSPRCRNVDLSRWFTGRYVIPTAKGDPADADEDSGES